jgi:hypothetical protein
VLLERLSVDLLLAAESLLRADRQCVSERGGNPCGMAVDGGSHVVMLPCESVFIGRAPGWSFLTMSPETWTRFPVSHFPPRFTVIASESCSAQVSFGTSLRASSRDGRHDLRPAWSRARDGFPPISRRFWSFVSSSCRPLSSRVADMLPPGTTA